jgi:hypothetical protein
MSCMHVHTPTYIPMQVYCLNDKCISCKDLRNSLTTITYSKETPPGACRPPLDGTVPIFDLKRSLAFMVATTQKHGHNHSCGFDPKKLPLATQDDMCRFARPWPVNPQTYLDTKSGCLHTRCDDGMLMPYLPALMLACPCNHAFYLMGDMSRHMREVAIWQRKTTADPNFKGAPPVCPSLVETARLASEYACELHKSA